MAQTKGGRGIEGGQSIEVGRDVEGGQDVEGGKDTHDAGRSPAHALAILVNGRPQQTGAMDLAAWVTEAGLVAERVATAVNGEFVARDRRAQQPLREGDRIDVFQAIVGG